MVVRPTICCWIFFFPPPCVSRNLAFDSPINASSIKGGESNAVLHTYEEVSSSLTHISQSFKISVMSILCLPAAGGGGGPAAASSGGGHEDEEAAEKIHNTVMKVPLEVLK